MPPVAIQAAGLTASDGASNDQFGSAVSLSGGTGLIGAFGASNSTGAAYLFRQLDTGSGAASEEALFTASSGVDGNQFGYSVSASSLAGLIGAPGANLNTGSAYVLRDLDTATGTANESVTLTASDGSANSLFGASVSLSGSSGLVGAYGTSASAGAAYLFRGLATATNSVTEHAKLTASDAAANDFFGNSVSLSGNTAVIGAYGDDFGTTNLVGSAYVFRHLDTAAGTVTQEAKLIASDGAAGDRLGYAVSASGTMGLAGAWGDSFGSTNQVGSAYVFRGLDTAAGTVTQNLKLTASDGAATDRFGYAVSLSGTTGLVGAYLDNIGSNFDQGSAYLFLGLDAGGGTRMQNVKLTASDGGAFQQFGASVSIDGDGFLIGAPLATGATVGSGQAYTGSVSSVTTLDAGGATRTIDGISFVSRDDWIIGQATDGNQITLMAGNTATVTNSGKAVYIGQNAGSDNNTLVVNGTLNAGQIQVGTVGNTGNKLVVNGSIGNSTVTINSGGTLTGSGTVGSLTVANGGTISPGNSPGTQNVAGNLTWLAGGNYNWETLNTVGTPGTEWDLISATGVLDLSALTIGSEFNINLWSLQSTGPDVNGNIANFDNTQPYQWLIASAAGGITGFTGTDQFDINTGAFNGTAGFSNPLGAGSFNISQSGNNLYLNFDPSGAAVPEPGTWAAAALLVAGATVVRWRRRKQRQST